MSEIIDLYNKIENDEFNKLTFEERILYIPQILKDYNYGKINNENELCFNVCREHTGRSEKIIDILCNGIKRQELDKIININKIISKKNFNWHFKVVPTSSIFMHTYQKRLIDKFYPNAKNILELGPGSGYLSVLLANDNKTLFTTDVFQPHYIYQNFIYKNCSNLNEMVLNSEFILKPNMINHIPWWKFKNLKGKEFKIDLIIMNHMIVEMHTNSLKRNLAIFNLFKNPDIFLESTGDPIYNSWDITQKILNEYYYKLSFKGGGTKDTNKVYIFKKDLADNQNIKIDKKNSFLKKLYLLLPFRKVFLVTSRYILNEIWIFLKKISRYNIYERKKIDYKRNIKNFTIFKEKNELFYKDIIKIYNDNGWDINCLDSKFKNSLKPKKF